MLFLPLPIPGAFVIEMEPHRDERGFFARSWSASEFRDRGLSPTVAECSISLNPRSGTLRGMHYQAAPHGEAKLVRCTRGAAFDVLVDLRSHSPTFRRFAAVRLTSDNRKSVYIPDGCAHGFQTLQNDTELWYQISHPHRPDQARGVRWNDPAFGIPWPSPPALISQRDATFPDFQG